MQIGAKIKALRLKKGLTQEEFLGTTPKDFFDDSLQEQKVIYNEEDQTSFVDEEKKYKIQWLIPASNEKEMEPVLITLQKDGEYKQFEPSLAETFIFVLKGRIRVVLGKNEYIACEGNAIYYEASMNHQIVNANNGITEILLVATESYL